MHSRIVSSGCQAIVVATALVWPAVTIGAPQDPPSAPVTVVNKPANPVPVTGTVGVSGTVDVDGTVTVINPDNLPVPIRDAGQPQPVEGTCSPFSLTRTAICNDIFTVPAGKRLVVELISYNIRGSTEANKGNPVEIWFGDAEVMNCGNCASRYFLSPVFAGILGSLRIYADMRQTRVYLDQGKSLGARVEWDQNDHLGAEIAFSGFLVNR